MSETNPYNDQPITPIVQCYSCRWTGKRETFSRDNATGFYHCPNCKSKDVAPPLPRHFRE